MPSFNPFGGSKNSAALFEIRLDSDIIVLRGPENEAASQVLKGSVVLCLPSALKVEDVHLRLTGHCKIGQVLRSVGITGAKANVDGRRWNDPKPQNAYITSSSVTRIEKAAEIFNHKWPPFVGGEGNGSSSKSTTLAAGNYEWPFELVIPGSAVESVEGLVDVHVIYKLKATVARGRLSSDLHAYKPVRIIRTLDPSALELSHAMTVENVWPNKVEYSILIPQKAVIFGTSIQVEMQFTPLLKGLKVTRAKCELMETHEWSLYLPTTGEHHSKKTRAIAVWDFEMKEEEHYQDVINEDGQDGWVLKDILRLPKTLKLCMQDVDTPGIKIRHKVKFTISLENPDGHISELRASLPVTILISPNMPLDASGNLLDQTPGCVPSLDTDTNAPPLYGEHILDQLYADLDHSGLVTPSVQSGMNSPVNNQSRRGSQEDLGVLGRRSGSEVGLDALSSRLQNLNSSNSTTAGIGGFFRRNNGSSSGGNTPLHHGHGSTSSIQNVLSRPVDSDASASRSDPMSRRASDDERISSTIASGQQTPEHIDFSDIDLSQVPSYATAIKQQARTLSYSDARTLPNYNTAISAPPSPELAHTNTATTVRPNRNGSIGSLA